LDSDPTVIFDGHMLATVGDPLGLLVSSPQLLSAEEEEMVDYVLHYSFVCWICQVTALQMRPGISPSI
jgi:hypothetical protein